MMFKTLAPVSLTTLLAFVAVSTEAREPQVYFNYETSRQVFRELANEVISNQNYGSPENRPSLEKIKVEYPGSENNDLTIDALIIPARKKRSVVIQINSGVHGLETPTGSYLQQRFLSECLPSLPEEFLDETTFVVTHSLNPWGFKHANRFNANNVDLNRNCGGAKTGGEFDVCDAGKPNKDYNEIKWLFDRLVESDAPINLELCKLEVGAAALYYGGLSGPSSFLEKALKGQTEDPNGIYFAGKELQRECKAYQHFSKQFYEGENSHRDSLTLTWHTGYGTIGHLQLMGDRSDLDDQKLVGLLKDQAFVPGELQQLDLDPRFKTCNDENVWLRRVEPDRQPNAGTALNGYLTAEIGGRGGLDSVCAVLKARQVALRQQIGKPLFDGNIAAEKEFRNQVFGVFNPTDDKVYTQASRKNYSQILDDHAKYSCQAIEKYIRAVSASPTGQPDEGNAAATR